MNEAEESTIISICVFNAFTSYTAIMLNIITIIALRKTSSLPRTLKTLLLNLVVSDLGVGLLVQPLFVALHIMAQNPGKNHDVFNAMKRAFAITTDLLCCASILGVTAISADRFLAIHLHLRYQELVTHKRVVAGVISIWVFSAFFSLLTHFWTVPKKTSFVVNLTILIVCIVSTALIYVKLYLVVRHHLNPIHVLQEQGVAQNGAEVENSARQRKSAVATFFMYVVFLVCYLPSTIIAIVKVSGHTTFLTIFALTDTLLFLNSSLNPLIYSWKMRHIRHTIMSIPHNIYTSLSNR